jgi:NAD(P)-dependent dehydrogenase (short-subunit alcohol dehydrogenase family)
MAKQARSLTGKVVIVTGGAGGVGKALAQQLYGEGAHVAICDLVAEQVQAVIEETSARPGGGSIAGRAFDLADREAYTAFIADTEDKLGPLDILVNNAGIMPVGPFEDEKESTAAKQVDVNLHAVLHGTKEAIRRMKPRGRGHIVNVASGAGWVPGAGGVTYSATKFGVVGLTQALDLELHGSGVDISVVAPAVIKTQLSAGLGEVKGLKASTPEEVAAEIVKGLKYPRFAIFVPKAMGVMALVYSALPFKLRGLLARTTGSDKLLFDVDQHERDKYDAAVGLGKETPDTAKTTAREIPAEPAAKS